MNAVQKELARKKNIERRIDALRREGCELQEELDSYRDDAFLVEMISEAVDNLEGAYMIVRKETA